MNVIAYQSNQIIVDNTLKAEFDELILQYYEIWISEGVFAVIRCILKN